MKRKKRHTLLWANLFIILGTLVIGAWLLLSHGIRPSEEKLKEHRHRLTVLTWNTGRMGNFKKPASNEVLKFLLKQRADVICLQEVDVYKNDRYLTLAEVKQELGKKYPYSYIDFKVYNSRHQYGTMVWSRFPIIHKQSIHYETQGNLSNRCDIIVKKDTIRLINNHLESYSFTSDDLAEMDNQHNYEAWRSSAKRLEEKWQRALPLRNKQARIIREEIDKSPHPCVVVGDFNSIPLSYVYWKICRGLHDVWSATSIGRLGATCEKRGIGMRIDYILCSKSLIPVSCEVPEATGSDHLPVVGTIAW